MSTTTSKSSQDSNLTPEERRLKQLKQRFQHLYKKLDKDYEADKFISASTEFLLRRSPTEEKWIIPGILLPDRPCAIVAPSKSMKSSIVYDLAVSIVTETPFLGMFDVRKDCLLSVMIISAEGRADDDISKVKRIVKARGLTMDQIPECSLRWLHKRPNLSSETDIEELEIMFLAEYLYENQTDVLIIDPLYPCLFGDSGGKGATNLFTIGAILNRLHEMCQSMGITLILVHHSVESPQSQYGPLTLGDISFPGLGQFAAQWMLINRRAEYEAGKPHKLWLEVGGRAGHSQLLALDIDEGTMIGNDLSSMSWDVTVKAASEVQEKQQRGNRKQKRQSLKLAKSKVLKSLDSLTRAGEQPTRRRIRDETKLNGGTVKRAVDGLIESGTLEEVDVPLLRQGKPTSKLVEILRRSGTGS